MRPNHQPCLIISGFKKNNESAANWARHDLLEEHLLISNQAFKQLTGTYEGIEELGFLVVLFNEEDKAFICSLAVRFEQECVLYLNEDRDAFFIDLKTGEEKLAGKFKNVGKYKPTSGDFTYDGVYYYQIV